MIKQRLEKFLAGHIYIFMVAMASLAIWSTAFYMPASQNINATFGGILVLAVIYFLILFFYENTIYTIPIILSLLFTIGIANINISSIETFTLGFIAGFLIIAGCIIHLIKFKVKPKLNALGLSLIAVAISFMVPVLYQPYTETLLLLSSMGLLYLFIFLFYSNTIKGNQMNYLFRNLAMIGLMLSLQLTIIFFHSLFTNPQFQNVNIYEHFLEIFPANKVDLPGWGNMNDLTIHIVLSCAAVFYYMRKYPKNLLPWLGLGWVAIWIMISFSKGSMVTIVIVFLGAVIYAIFKRDKRQIINLGIIFVIIAVIILLNLPIVTQLIEDYKESVDAGPESFLSGRTKLWWDHELSAVELFKQFPVFGYGWDTPLFILAPGQNRTTIYHSTFFHVLATGGIFGLLALVFHFTQIGILLARKPMDVGKKAIIFTYVVTQFHGMLDNTQWMVHYTIMTLVMFAVIDVSYPVEKTDEVMYAQPAVAELGLAHNKE